MEISSDKPTKFLTRRFDHDERRETLRVKMNLCWWQQKKKKKKKKKNAITTTYINTELDKTQIVYVGYMIVETNQ